MIKKSDYKDNKVLLSTLTGKTEHSQTSLNFFREVYFQYHINELRYNFDNCRLDNYSNNFYNNGRYSNNIKNSILSLSINHFRAILDGLHNFITTKTPDFKINAASNNMEEQRKASDVSKMMLFMYKRDKWFENVSQSMYDLLLYGQGFISVRLKNDVEDGESIGDDELYTESNINENILITSHRPYDVYWDKTDVDPSYYIIREEVDKEVLMAEYKLKKDEIIGGYESIFYNSVESQSEQISFYTLFDYRLGKKVKFISNRILEKKDLRGECVIPLYIHLKENTSVGSSNSADLLSLQKQINLVKSRQLTNFYMFSNKIIAKDSNVNVNLEQLQKQNLIFDVDTAGTNTVAGMINTIDLNSNTQDADRLYESYVKDMEILSGLNSVARGSNSGNQSGKALALQFSVSHQFVSGHVSKYREAFESLGRKVFNIIKLNYPDTNTYNDYQFTNLGEKLFDEFDINIELDDPVANTKAGKMELADKLFQMKLIQSPEEYLKVIETGKIGHLTSTDTGIYSLVEDQKEMIINGSTPEVFLHEDHEQLINGVREILNDVKYYKNIQIREICSVIIEKRKLNWIRASGLEYDTNIGKYYISKQPEHMSDRVEMNLLGYNTYDKIFPGEMLEQNIQTNNPIKNDFGGNQPQPNIPIQEPIQQQPLINENPTEEDLGVNINNKGEQVVGGVSLPRNPVNNLQPELPLN